jgi:alpha-L-arabinofuranosidase
MLKYYIAIGTQRAYMSDSILKTKIFMKIVNFLTAVLLVLTTGKVLSQAPLPITVNAAKPLSDVSPSMWGVFFEDINFAADGGLYSELVKNRSFEFSHPMMGWKQVREKGDGRVVATFHSPSNASNPRYMRIYVDAQEGYFGIANEGFRGMGIRRGEKYNLSLSASVYEGESLTLKAEIVGSAGEVLGFTDIEIGGQGWKKYVSAITAANYDEKASLRLLFTGRGSAGLDLVSLTPSDTWKGRPGGLRKDIAQMIADLRPGFVRFPGGCIVEGRDITNRYQWKATVGPVDERKLMINRWNNEMQNRTAPDYFQSFGLGFYEYFLFAEDIGAEPLPILNCGMSCQFNAGEVVPLEDLDPYIQDALDLIEFANGSATTAWGKLRASMGHPAPFNLKYVGVGNEQWDVQYIERYREFEKVLRSKHPEIMIVSGSGPSASGRMFDYAWNELRKLDPDLIDEHYYMPPDWFLKNAGRYDNYDRKGPKVFAGEYAAHWKEGKEAESRNTWYSALAEAAFMTGLERNADIVRMASYAPLLAHVDAWQWRPDLIWFTNTSVFGTPNYYVQKLFSNNRGTNVISVTTGGRTLAGADSLYASATIDTGQKRITVKVVNSSLAKRNVSLSFEGRSVLKSASLITLSSAERMAFNSATEPEKIIPVTSTVTLNGKKLNEELDPLSLNVFIISYK